MIYRKTITAVLLLAALTGCLPALYLLYDGEYNRIVLSHEAIQVEYQKTPSARIRAIIAGGRVPLKPSDFPEVAGFYIPNSNPPTYYISKDYVGTSVERHEQHHLRVGGFHD